MKTKYSEVSRPKIAKGFLIGPEACRLIVPKEILERWEDTLCESLILGAEKFYCPFKDCSAMLVNDGGEAVTSSECPHCYRLFCAQCKVAWHSEMSCSDFQRWKKGEIDQSDAMMMGLAKNKKWKKCPRCSYYVELASGCLHIRCSLDHLKIEELVETCLSPKHVESFRA
ncbi:zinc finger, C6HC-type containing protein [Tanacetum coccineum]